MSAVQEIFDVIREGDTGRLGALLAADASLAGVRNERGHSPVLIAQYHHRRGGGALLLPPGAGLGVVDAAPGGAPARVGERPDPPPSPRNAPPRGGFYPLRLGALLSH